MIAPWHRADKEVENTTGEGNGRYDCRAGITLRAVKAPGLAKAGRSGSHSAKGIVTRILEPGRFYLVVKPAFIFSDDGG